MYSLYWKQIQAGRFDPRLSLFGLPFLIGSCFLVALCAMSVAGEVAITQDGDRLSIFTGVGWVGWTRNYAWPDFSSAREGFEPNTNNRTRTIVLEGKRRTTFGSMLSEERRYFLLAALQAMLRNANRPQTAGFEPPRFR